MIRIATLDDAAGLARLINDAFIVEAFFKIGNRTSAGEIVELMNTGGEFLVLDNAAPGNRNREPGTRNREPGTRNREPGTGNPEPGTPLGCVYLTCGGDRGYFGMLSVDPTMQGQGLGRRLIDAVEARARQRGCRYMDIHIVNLREELPAYYRRLGYVEQGTLPFSVPDRASRPCHFIVMSKSL